MTDYGQDFTCEHGEPHPCPHGCPEPDAARADRLLSTIRDGAWLDSQTFPPLTWAVPGIIPEGFTLLVGPPKAGKSWLILSTLLAVASGGRALGRIPVNQGRVLYLALEDGHARMQERCRALMAGEPLPELYTYATRVTPTDVLATIEVYLDRHPDTALVVIDTLGKVMPPAQQGETTYSRDYRVGGRLKAISDAHSGLALVVVHHDRKANANDFVERVSGTNGLAGAADTIAVLSRERQSEDGTLSVTGRDVEEGEYALTMTAGSWTLDGANLAEAARRVREREEEQSLSGTTSDVLRLVREAGPAGVKAAVLAEKFGSGVYEYLRRQVTAGRLVKPSRGLYMAPESVRSVRTEGSENHGSHTSHTFGDLQDAPLWPDEPPTEDEW